jgi:hypothetical protein
MACTIMLQSRCPVEGHAPDQEEPPCLGCWENGTLLPVQASLPVGSEIG